jgi:hypothetical protein
MSGVVVPSSDTANYPLYAQIVQMQTLVTANKNPVQSAAYRQQLPALQHQLVANLLASNKLPPATILSTCTYGQADSSTY